MEKPSGFIVVTHLVPGCGQQVLPSRGQMRMNLINQTVQPLLILQRSFPHSHPSQANKGTCPILMNPNFFSCARAWVQHRAAQALARDVQTGDTTPALTQHHT